MAFYSVKKRKQWIWKAYCRTTGQLIDWECGSRDRGTLGHMLQRLEKWKVSIYFSDRWDVYAELITSAMLIQTKAETYGIEHNNGRQRHWCARFRRRTCVVSRSVQMVDYAMMLFAKHWVNGTYDHITLLT